MAFLVELSVVLVTIITGIILYFKWKYSYWERRKLPYMKPSIPFGTFGNIFSRKKSIGYVLKDQYTELKSQGHKHSGLYNFASPAYMPLDLELIKDITIKSFDSFVDRGVYHNERDDPFSANLFNIDGDKWRRLRKHLTPTFTSGKMKMMFDTLLNCTTPLKEALDEMADNKTPMDVKEIVALFSTDVIGSCIFGIECNSFKSPDAEFRKYGRKVFERNLIELLQLIFVLSNPDLGRFLRMTITPKDTTDFFMKVIKDCISFRESNNFHRKDMFQLLIELKNKKLEPGETPLSIDEIAAQAFVFFVGGFETTSSTISFLLYELAIHQDIQQKVREEIIAVLAKHDGKITYESLGDLKYTTQAIDETLRKYPSVTQTLRKCVEDHQVPGTNVVLEKGTQIFIPVLGIHHDPEYWPNPEKYDPERFSEENKKNIAPFTYMPFGEGPRMCIGSRFAQMQIKAVTMALLPNFIFSVNKKTPVPLEIDPLSIVLAAKGSFLLDVARINN